MAPRKPSPRSPIVLKRIRTLRFGFLSEPRSAECTFLPSLAVCIFAVSTDARGTCDTLARSDMIRLTLESDALMLVER